MHNGIAITAYRNFCCGLDNDSAITASRILAIPSLQIKQDKDFLTPQEYADMMENRKKLDTGIFKITNDCYAFGKYMLPINQFEYSVFCYKHGLDTVDLSKISDDSVIFDVGGFVGDSALIFRDYLANKIYSFEPSRVNFSSLNRTVEMNQTGDQIIPVRLVLTDSKDAVLYDNSEKNRGTFRPSNASVGDRLPCDTLDNFAMENSLKVGLIKVDIEGGEQAFLHGAKEIISRDKPILLLSIYHPWSDLDFFKVKEIVESWNLGYKFRIFKPMDTLVAMETLLICEQP